MTELTAALRKDIASLAKNARTRREMQMFVAEGTKCVLDTIHAFECRYIFATSAWIEKHAASLPHGIAAETVRRSDLERMSHMSTAPEVMAIYRMPVRELNDRELKGRLSIALDGIQDPGNLGTIIRVADWMGVRHIVCSRDTVDVYNPKVVQATMGAISRVKVYYADLSDVLCKLRESMPVYGTFLDGDNIYATELTEEGIIVMGNEGKGVSEPVASLATERLYIPSYPPGEQTSESLNVAVATAITLSEFRRQNTSSRCLQ